MSLEAGQYVLACWNSTENPSDIKRPHLMHQCHKLIKALRAKLTGSQIIVPSRDAKETRKGIEICVMYRGGTGSSFVNVADTLNQEAEKLALDYKKFVEQEESLTRYFNEKEMENLAEFAKPIEVELSEKDFEELDRSLDSFSGFDLVDSWARTVPKEKMQSPLMMTRKTLASLRKAEKDDLRNEITGYMDSLNASCKTTKTAWQTIMLIAGGVIAVGGYIAKASGVWATIAVCIEFVGVVTMFIGVAATAAIIGVFILVLGAIVGGLYLIFKGAQNCLLVVNNSHSDVRPVDHYIESGQLTSATSYLPASRPNDPAVWVGWFIYDRKKGFYGTSFSLTLGRNGGDVTIGMDCPNSLFGGRNSVVLVGGSDRKDTEFKARNCHDKDATVEMSTGKTVARIASKYGNINWGYCIFDGQ